MASRFESWFLYFVAEHNIPPPGLGGGNQINIRYEGLADDVVQTASESMSVSNDFRQVFGMNVLLFRPRETFKGNSPSVA
jgi:hypothetical protein